MFGVQSYEGIPKSVTLHKPHFQPTFGFTLRHVIVYPPESPRSDPERSAFGVSGEESIANSVLPATSVVQVHTVHFGGAGDLGGLRQGDRILSINGHQVSNCPYDQVVRRIQSSGDCLSLMVVPANCAISPVPYPLAPPSTTIWSSSASVDKSHPDSCLVQSRPQSMSSYIYDHRMDTAHPYSSKLLPDSPCSGVGGSQSDRIEALMSEMVHKEVQGAVAPELLTQTPQIRGAFSYDNIHNYCPPAKHRGPPPPYRPRPPSYQSPMYKSNDCLVSNTPPPPLPIKPTMIVQFQDNNYQKPTDRVPGIRNARAPLQHGRSIDNVLSINASGHNPGKRGSLATLPEIKENLQIDLSSGNSSPLSRPSLSPFKSGKVSNVPKSLSFESGLQQSALFKTNHVQGGRGESERLLHLQKVSKLAKQFEEGPVDLVGPLKLYHAQTYKRELQRIATTNEAGGIKRVKQAAQSFESSSSCSPSPLRLSVASSSSEVSGRYYTPAPQSRSASIGQSSNYEQIVLEQLNQRRNSRSVTCSPQRTDVSPIILARSSPDLTSPRMGNKRRTRPQSFLAAVTGDDQFTFCAYGDEHVDSNTKCENMTEIIGHPGVGDASKKSVKAGPTHRMSRFMNLFSSAPPTTGHHTSSLSADQLSAPVPITQVDRCNSAEHVLNEMCLMQPPLSTYNCISCDGIKRQGPVWHAQSALGQPKLVNPQWKKCWAIAHQDSHLYLCHQRPHKTIIDEERVLQVASDSVVVELAGSIVDIAYDIKGVGHKESGRAHVIRISTQQHIEHVVQVDGEDIMLQWIDALQKSVNTNSENDTDSMALIIKRYETKKKESRSPAQQKQKKQPLKIGASASAPISDSPSTPHSVAQNSTSSPPQIESKLMKGSSNDQKDKGDTPNRARRWKKVGKSGSCPQPIQGAGGPAFGQNLEDCATSGETDFVPLLVQLCVKVVEAHGLDNVGVYRIPGNTAAVNALCTSLDKGFEHVDFSDPRWKDVNVVSSLLKAFFRRLPEPMLTDKLYPMFIDANRQENHAKRMHKLRHLIHKLPKHNYECLRYLMSHLNRVVTNCDVNKMEARNLALMFGPSLVRPSGDNMSAMVSHMSDQCKIVESLIIYADWLFDANKERPTPNRITTERPNDQMTSSFSDMSDLLRRVHKTEEDLEKTKDNIVRSILNVRRGSRKGQKGGDASSSQRDSSAQNRSPRKRYARPAKSHSDKPLLVERVFNGDYQERNIDAEIEIRLKSQTSEVESPVAPLTSTPGEDKDQAIQQMRKHREENIYTARRIFIAGPQAGASTPPATLAGSPGIGESFQGLSPDPSGHMQRMSVKHLNLNALDTTDILSPETREKIRKLKEQGKLAHSGTVEYVSSDDLPSSSSTSLRRTPPRTALDSASITSDYSTTSSTPGGLAQPLITSVNGTLASSDYSSSPLTSTDSRVGSAMLAMTQSQTSVESESTSESVPTPTAAPSSLLYDRKRLRHVQPAESTFLGNCPRRLPEECSTGRSDSECNRRLCRERAWYEEEEDSPALASNPVSVVRTASDKVNGLGPKVMSKVAHSAPQTPHESSVSVDNRPVSRISQKIKFRSKSTSADKRKDIRRHTLSDMEQTTLRSVLLANQNNQTGANVAHSKWKRSSKLKAWFKDSFRKSSPDLATGDMPTTLTVI